jgi:hypothetical protein
MAKEHQNVAIKTPKCGKDTFIYLLTYKDDIFGTIKFDNKIVFEQFKENYNNLPEKDGWGSIILTIDTE